ncbi:cubilin-like [Euwallacea similis]|uniref:cubilin-like n=1 Tax=Euwallacea similis TaxID=1736056 RepID=UPI00344F9B04
MIATQTKLTLLITTITSVFSINIPETQELALVRNATRTSRQDIVWLPFFWSVGLVRFLNSECNAGNGFSGTCYTRRECNYLDGSRAASCANSAGVCCVFQRTCGGSSHLNNTYFVSPGFPATYKGGTTCSFTIEKQPDACQVRLDFLTLNLAQPNSNGTCITDALTVTGGASIVPIICGENNGQHIYVDFNGNTSITITIYVRSASSASRSWNIKIAQINCNCPWRAPTGCLQFYNELSGTVRSFNYGSSSVLNGTRQLAGLNYGVCVNMFPGYCSIQWSATSDPYSFSMTGNTFLAVGDNSIGTALAALTGNSCLTDFVVIPAPILNGNSTPLNTDRFCGNGFLTVTSYSKPFVLTVVTDGNELNDRGNRGFALSFMQELCSGALLTG